MYLSTSFPTADSVKIALSVLGWRDKSLPVIRKPDGVLFPLTNFAAARLSSPPLPPPSPPPPLLDLSVEVDPQQALQILLSHLPLRDLSDDLEGEKHDKGQHTIVKRRVRTTPQQRMRSAVEDWIRKWNGEDSSLSQFNIDLQVLDQFLNQSLPRKWEKLGPDLLLFPEEAFFHEQSRGIWMELVPSLKTLFSSDDQQIEAMISVSPTRQLVSPLSAPEVELWRAILRAMDVPEDSGRVGIQRPIDKGILRESRAVLLFSAVKEWIPDDLPLPLLPAGDQFDDSYNDNGQGGSSDEKEERPCSGSISQENKQKKRAQKERRKRALQGGVPRGGGWVRHCEGSVQYCFDVTRSMFSSGNVTERMRMRQQSVKGQIVVDLYAGVGYFTLAFLLAGAERVEACEWNVHSVRALRSALRCNAIHPSRCRIHLGDNAVSSSSLRGVAQRVNLGLLPSSRQGWSLAALVLSPETGGVMHIHENVAQGEEPNWQLQVCQSFQNLLDSTHSIVSPWIVRVLHIERVKAFGPRVFHLVMDLLCIPKAL